MGKALIIAEKPSVAGDIARALDRNIARSWGMIIVPNVICVAGVFTLGFGVGMSVLTNNVAAIGALIGATHHHVIYKSRFPGTVYPGTTSIPGQKEGLLVTWAFRF
mgnify:CR=1 FL=1